MIFQAKYLLFLSLFIKFVALLTGILSLALPFWIDAENEEGEVVVKVLRKSQSGLWQKRDTFELQENRTSESKWDETWQPLHGTSLNSGELQAVKGLMITGLISVLVCLICSIKECRFSEEEYLKHLTTIFYGTFFTTLVSLIFMAIGPILFSSTVFHNYKYDKKSLHVGFWLAVVSAVACLVALVLSIITYICFRRKKRTISRRSSRHSTTVRY